MRPHVLRQPHQRKRRGGGGGVQIPIHAVLFLQPQNRRGGFEFGVRRRVVARPAAHRSLRRLA
jgi:hypothetical protein